MSTRVPLVVAVFGIVVIGFSGCATSEASVSPEPVARAEHEPTGPPPPSASRAFVAALHSWDNLEMAIDLYGQAIELDPDHALAYYQRAELLREIGALEPALEHFSRAIEIDPGFLQARIQRGYLRMWEMGDEGGVEDIEIAYSIDPHDLPVAMAFADALEWREPDRAFEILSRLTHEHPDNPGPYLRRAKMYRDHGDYRASAEDFEAAIRRGLDEPWIRAERAMVLVALGDVGEARREMDVVAEHDPESPEVGLVLARLAILDGDSDSAARLYRVYLQSEWIHQPVKLEAAFVAASTGDRRQAEELIRSFVRAEDDILRERLAAAGVLALAGESSPAAERLERVVREADWYAPAWVMLAVLAQAGVDVSDGLESDLRRKIAEIREDLRRLVFDHTELLVWVKLFSATNPELGDLDSML